jgi:Na+-translocating ferredoxin:NAD+ oxidoreductase RnfG subunit
MKNQKWRKYLFFAVIIIFIINIIGLFIAPKSQADIQKEKSDSTAKANDELLFKMYYISEQFIKENLRDPDSYQKIEHKSYFIKEDKKEKTYIQVSIKYRAKNGFGGMNVKKRYFDYAKNMALIETFEE